MELNMFDLYKNLTKEGIIFCFCGSASQSIVEGIGETLWHRMEIEGHEISVIGKVFPIFVEQMQNIVSHSAEIIKVESDDSEELRFGIILVGIEDGRFYVRCGNYIENERSEELSRTLRELQSMDKQQLKAHFKERRKTARSVGTGKGSGLGFIEMARKASEPLDFDITRVNDERSFFSLTTII
ncbi:MAG: SiaB family protein kinase [Desulfomonilaceae bacterium]|nr:SiaB family protein kinase [Desulfomonilaceae bacterium]